MTGQQISGGYLPKRPASKAKAKPVQPQHRFAVSKAVLAGEEPLHRVSKKGNALCGAVLPKDISIVLERIENVQRCEVCGKQYARQVLAKDKRIAKRTKKSATKKRPASAKERKVEAAKRGMKSWRPELYPGESADRNTGKSGPVPRPVGAPSLGKRR